MKFSIETSTNAHFTSHFLKVIELHFILHENDTLGTTDFLLGPPVMHLVSFLGEIDFQIRAIS